MKMSDIKEVNAIAKLDLPKKVDSNLGKTLVNLSEGLSSLMQLPEKTLNLVQSTGNTLLSPFSALLQGISYKITCSYLPYKDEIDKRKEISQIKLAKAVVENLAEKENNGEEIPNKVEDTDTLFAIQNAASEISDEEFIKFWAHIYTEEACKPNTISKRTIELCKSLDKNTAKILQDNIIPYCDETFLWNNNDVPSITKALELNFISRQDSLMCFS